MFRNMPDLTDDEIKKYGLEVLNEFGEELNREGLKFNERQHAKFKEVFAMIGFCHLIAETARRRSPK